MGAFDWSPGIGDPTLGGWVTVLAYFATAWLCFRTASREKRGPPRPLRQTVPAIARVFLKHWPRPPGPARRAALWLGLGALMIGLGINKQLDLQTLLTEIGRVMAHGQGWYEQRRVVQAVFIVAVLALGCVGAGVVWWLSRGSLAELWLALAGTVFLLTFIVIRAASFHHVDVLIGTRILGLRLNWIFELGGIGMVALAAHRRSRAAQGTVG